MSRNRLASETSPYLLQHQDNPVHWWPWGSEALAEAKKTNKPVLLSVGYAACHWCHVMAHESFEDPEVAEVMNELFVNIKVDREERPDVDAIYMSALHSLGEQGGWPLTMFLDGDGRPFWGGTYFPKQPRYGRPGFIHVMREVARIYADEQDRIAHNTAAIIGALQTRPQQDAIPELSDQLIERIARQLLGLIDPVRGGVRGAPKFPQVGVFAFLWRAGISYNVAAFREAVELTLTHICQGGIYDHLAGGFARYSVDDRWLVPHFEKMLYDNALLLRLMTEVWTETRDPLLEHRIAETANWLLSEMIAEGGGFASSLDADSEGVEGKFYVWSNDEVLEVLGADDGSRFCQVYDVTEDGNWEGNSILNRLESLALFDPETEADLAAQRAALLAHRAGRIRPGWDDKVLADWNGLAITALARAGRVFDRADWSSAAQRAYQFVVDTMWTDGRLVHSYRAGIAKAPATSSDYANMITAALTFFELTSHERYLAHAVDLEKVLTRYYWSEEHGGYHLTASDTPDLIVRTISAADDATPNANGVMVSNLMKLYQATGDVLYRSRADAILAAFGPDLVANVFSHVGLLDGALSAIEPMHLVLVGQADAPDTAALARAVDHVSVPGAFVQHFATAEAIPEGVPAAGKKSINGRPTAFVCVGSTCSPPVTDPEALTQSLRAARSRSLTAT